MNDINTDSKFALRKKYRDIRAVIPTTYRTDAAIAAAKLFANHPLFKRSHHIACYLAVNNEFDTSPIIEAIWLAKKFCYLPVLTKEQEKSLFFVRYEQGDPLHRNRYSILEPINISQKISPDQLDITITPLVAFDLLGHRLGTGGGYYDRTFAFLHETTEKKPHMLGLAYAAQQTQHLPFDPWDILLEGVITEQSIIIFP